MILQDLVDLGDHIVGAGGDIAALIHHDLHVVLPCGGKLAPCGVLDAGIDQVQVVEDALECGLCLQESIVFRNFSRSYYCRLCVYGCEQGTDRKYSELQP